MDVQQILSLGIVAAAAGALGNRAYRKITGKDGGHCAGCGECGRPPREGVRPAPQATPLVTLTIGAPMRKRAESVVSAEPRVEAPR